MSDSERLRSLLKELSRIGRESEWLEFKENYADIKGIGEYISALANSAALLGKQTAYMIWGVDDQQHAVIGTDFRPSQLRYKQQELESWLLQKLSPKLNFAFNEFTSENGQPIVILEIQAASHTPVQFDGTEFIRIGSYKKALRAFPEKERELWRVFDRTPFEQQIAADALTDDDVLKLLAYPSYFELTEQPLPENKEGILAALLSDRMLLKGDDGKWCITNLGAILFARHLDSFQSLARKAVRLIYYRGNSRIETLKEIEGNKGYALGYSALIDFIKALLPSNEEIGKAFRKEVPIYPDLAIRELVANAIIHQDFAITGTGPIIELFDERLEITNPGLPLVDINRLIDSPPRSRNEALASFMRRIKVCEERGSGIDKVVFQTELYQLPAPKFEVIETHTRSTLFAPKSYKAMDTEAKVRACYLHCCLKYVNHEVMNNTSLRERFSIQDNNAAVASRIIKQTIEAGLIRVYDESANRRSIRYVPAWA